MSQVKVTQNDDSLFFLREWVARTPKLEQERPQWPEAWVQSSTWGLLGPGGVPSAIQCCRKSTPPGLGFLVWRVSHFQSCCPPPILLWIDRQTSTHTTHSPSIWEEGHDSAFVQSGGKHTSWLYFLPMLHSPQPHAIKHILWCPSKQACLQKWKQVACYLTWMASSSISGSYMSWGLEVYLSLSKWGFWVKNIFVL